MDIGQEQTQKNHDQIKEIPKWAERYAESRSTPLIVFQAIFLAMVGMIALSVFCFLQQWFILAAVSLLLYMVTLLCLLFKWDKYEASYYAKTGIPEAKNLKQVRKYLVLPLLLIVVFSIIMEQQGYFPSHLRLPISAAFICPLLMFANWRWGKGSFFGNLWAFLYGAWGVAILFKLPWLTFSDKYAGAEIMVAVPLTGLITGLVGYLYNHHALKKLKASASMQENSNEE
ncbi:MAG: hypothetical protein JXA52_05385 [Planctomycetes bacterium]|nr:hypothetical protein [Planctomycetota bacterium]